MIFTIDDQTKSVKVKLEPEELELAKINPKSFKALMSLKNKFNYKEIKAAFNLINLIDRMKEQNVHGLEPGKNFTD